MRQIEVPDHLVPALSRMLAISAKKRNDYSRVGPWANFRDTSEFFGLRTWQSAIFNVVQKLARVRSLSDGRKIENEPLEDTLLDLANYALFTYAMYLEEQEAAHPEPSERESGSEIDIDGLTLRTDCGHSFVTCHTSRCFRATGTVTIREPSEYEPPKSPPQPCGACLGVSSSAHTCRKR